MLALTLFLCFKPFSNHHRFHFQEFNKVYAKNDFSKRALKLKILKFKPRTIDFYALGNPPRNPSLYFAFLHSPFLNSVKNDFQAFQPVGPHERSTAAYPCRSSARVSSSPAKRQHCTHTGVVPTGRAVSKGVFKSHTQSHRPWPKT